MMRNQSGFLRGGLIALCCGLMAMAFSGCGARKDDDKMLHLRGLATYREKMALTATARLEVELLDKTDTDATPSILGRVAVENAGQVPIGFEIVFNAAQFDQGHIYAVNASIYDQGGLLFTTLEPQGVDLEDLEGLLEVVLNRAE